MHCVFIFIGLFNCRRGPLLRLGQCGLCSALPLLAFPLHSRSRQSRGCGDTAEAYCALGLTKKHSGFASPLFFRAQRYKRISFICHRQRKYVYSAPGSASAVSHHKCFSDSGIISNNASAATEASIL